jgi:hypothetical protein
MELAYISDEIPFLRKHCRELGIHAVLSDGHEAVFNV